MGVKNGVLHFYPGEKRLLYIVNGKVVLEGEAWGGPSKTIPSQTMNMGPTDPGNYIIDSVAPYRTDTWSASKIRWGTPLMMKGSNLVYQSAPGLWSSVYEKTKFTTEDIHQLSQDLYGTKQIPDTWVFNDFGPLAVRYFKDLNSNGKRDKNEPLSGEMFHTTPDNEAQWTQGRPLVMQESHGCIHLKPLDRDQFIQSGAFASGTALTIHSYKERSRK